MVRYVADKDITNNELIVVQGHMHPTLYHRKLIASNVTGYGLNQPQAIKAKIRYRGKINHVKSKNWINTWFR